MEYVFRNIQYLKYQISRAKHCKYADRSAVWHYGFLQLRTKQSLTKFCLHIYSIGYLKICTIGNRVCICINWRFLYTFRDSLESQKIFLLYWRLEILLSMVVRQQGALPLGRQQRLVDVRDHLSRDIWNIFGLQSRFPWKTQIMEWFKNSPRLQK